MKVAMINGGVFGSTGKIMLGIADLLEKYGNQVFCAAPITVTNKDREPQREYYKIGTFFSRKINVLLSRVSGSSNCYAQCSTKKLLKNLAAFQPDVLHLHNLHGDYINLPLLFKYIKKYNVPVVWTLHDCWAFTGHCAHFSAAKCDRWKSGCGDCPQLKAYPKTYGADHTQRNYRQKQACFTGLANLTIIVPSEWLARTVKQSFLKEYPVEVVHNQIDKSLFKPTPSDFREQYGLDGKAVILGLASVWDKEKGLLDFCRLREKLDSRFAIVLVGVTDKQKSRLLPGILALPRTANPRELAEIYSAADVFVNPTHQDTYPTVNLEARACGTPVITYDVGGSPESAGGKYIVKENDIDGLAEQIYKLTEREAVELSV